VDEDAVIMTAYFRERHYPGAGHRGSALIDLYARRSVTASLLLRGIDGYGPGQPGGGRALQVPHDTPLTAVAVDTLARIDAMLEEEAAAVARPKLITLERARLLSSEIEPLWLGESPGEATRLTIYCGHADRVYQLPAFEAACEMLYRRGVAGATVLPGVDGTTGSRRQRTQFRLYGADAPLMVVTVGSGEQIAPLLPELGGLFRHPLMTIATVALCKRDGQVINRPETLPARAGATGPAGMEPQAKLTVYTSEAARINGQPAHREIIRQLRSAGVSGATAQRGTWGFHGAHAPHGGRLVQFGRHVPVVTTVIDRTERIGAAFDVIDKLTPDRGLVTAESVLTRPSACARGR